MTKQLLRAKNNVWTAKNICFEVKTIFLLKTNGLNEKKIIASIAIMTANFFRYASLFLKATNIYLATPSFFKKERISI